MRSDAMQPGAQTGPTSKGMIWTGRVITGLVILFLFFDGITKAMKVPAVLKAAGELGFSVREIVGIGIVLLICTALYAIPRTAILGAILLTGYLGGATVTTLRAGYPPVQMLIPVFFGVLVWAGIFFRDSRLRAMIPLRA
ncbi:MAG TPA: DoxX family protein [Candidatus Acidoferrales bacterium]|nr:DoxX family protein [Candidatus Acidoferrales bacterium]